MTAKVTMILGVLLLVSPALLFAGSACTAGASTGPTILRLNHTTDFDFAPSAGDLFYSIDLDQGKSYEFLVHTNYDDATNPGALAVSIYNVANGATCATPLTVNAAAGSAATGVRDTSAIVPAIPFNGFRGTVIATSSGSYKIKVHNNAANGVYLSVTVTETTLISAAYSQNGGGYSAYYSFVNASNQPIAITATAFNTAGAVQGTPFSSTVPSHGSISTNTGSMGVPSSVGYVLLVHDGPVEAISTVATEANFGFSPAYIQDVSFKPLHSLR